MNIQTWLNESTAALKRAGIASASLDATLLLVHVLNKNKTWLVAHNQQRLLPKQQQALKKMLKQRLEHTPLAYIIGCKEFYGHSFIVNESVLIPRPESEVLIEMLVGLVGDVKLNAENGINKGLDSRLRGNDGAGLPTIFDVGTGSGCLAISAALLLPGAHVSASDISEDALAVARANAKKHGVHIRFHQSDLLAKVPPMPSTRPYIILANLPYVPDGLITSPEITKEPAGALFSGSEGLDHYKRLWDQIAKLKNKPFVLITESLKNQHKDMEKMAKKTGYDITQKDGLVQVFNL